MNPAHLQIEPSLPRASGGQQVGLPSSGVRVTHLPTRLVATCECERSQAKNKAVCIAMLEYGLAELGWTEAPP